jgi:rhodanese-related sulfurtransferase
MACFFKRFWRVLVLAFGLMLSASCSQATGDFWVSQEKLAELVQSSGSGLLLMDVREAWEFRRGHIPGSMNVPLSRLAGHTAEVVAFLSTRPDLEEILLICNTHNRSRRAKEILAAEGLELRMRVLEMGVTGYERKKGG